MDIESKKSLFYLYNENNFIDIVNQYDYYGMGNDKINNIRMEDKWKN